MFNLGKHLYEYVHMRAHRKLPSSNKNKYPGKNPATSAAPAGQTSILHENYDNVFFVRCWYRFQNIS